METKAVCSECGATWQNGITCQEHFHQMLAWEMEYPGLGEVHHLMVLCYHLQHPSLYSPAALREGIRLLSDFLERGISPQQARRQNRAKVDSGKRTWKIQGTPASHGVYDPPVQWTMTAPDLTARGPQNYCESVHMWARSMLEAIQASGHASFLKSD